MRSGMAAALVVVFALLASPARAYTVETGFTANCHEEMTGAAYREFVLDLPLTDVPVPTGDDWRRVADFLLRGIGTDPHMFSAADRFVLMSALVGVRTPDTAGHAVLNFDQARALHTHPDPEVQHVHALRARGDNGSGGDESAVRGARRSIVRDLTKARDAVMQPASEQRITARMYVDFYGPIEVTVWAPGYWVGHAAHTLQDSFSHSLRNESNGFRTILTVFNFTEAIAGRLDESIDGLPHSVSMDRCGEATEPLVQAATAATRDLFVAVRELLRDRDPAAAMAVVDRWVVYEPGCDRDNDFCGNERWLSVAEDEVTTPPICAAAPVGTGRSTSGWVWLVPAVLLLRRRRR